MTFGDRELALASASAILQDIAPDVLMDALKTRPDDQFILPPATTFIEAGQVKPGLYLIAHGIIELFEIDANDDNSSIEAPGRFNNTNTFTSGFGEKYNGVALGLRHAF